MEVDIEDERWGSKTPRRRSRAVLDSLSKLSFFQAFITYLIVE